VSGAPPSGFIPSSMLTLKQVILVLLTAGCASSAGADIPSREITRDTPERKRGFYTSPPSYSSFATGKRPLGWLEPWADAPSPPSHTYTATDYAQDPDPPYILMIGPKKRDLASNSRLLAPDGVWDTWLRLYPRNLEFFLKRGTGSPRWPCVKAFILRARGEGGMRQWDTLPGSIHPLLHVVYAGTLENKGDGGIAGFCPPGQGYVDLFIGGDAGAMTGRHIPMEFQIITPDGGLKLEVRRTSKTGVLD